MTDQGHDEREQAELLAAARSEAERLKRANEEIGDEAFRLRHELKTLRGRERDLEEIAAGRGDHAARLEERLRHAQVFLERERQRRVALSARLEALQASSTYRLMRLVWRAKAAIKRPFSRSRPDADSLEADVPAIEPGERPPEAEQGWAVSPQADAPALPVAAPSVAVEVDPERRRWLAEAPTPRDPRELRVGAVLDEMSRACFAPECELIGFGPDDWRQVLEDRPPHLLLVESSWQGNGGSWQYQVASYTHPDYLGLPQLRSLLDWCREREIPTVFWNKEDPVHFDRFSEAAVLFDHVLTTDGGSVPRYEALAAGGEQTAGVLQFAAQPRIHNPIELTGERSNSPCFAGAYYRDRHIDRRRSLEMLLDAAVPFDLVIYDRRYGSEDKAFGFPERYSSHVREGVPYDQMVAAYKRHKLFLNVNSVADSPTMFSRRVFELAACDTAVLSTESVGMANTFGDLVPTVDDPEEAARLLTRLLEDEDYRRELVIPARRLVLNEHTYRQRLTAVAATAGYEVSADAGEEFAVLVLVDNVDQARGVRALVTSISEQTAVPTELMIGVGAGTSVAGDLQQLTDAAERLRVRVTHQDADSSRLERFRELASIAASPWLAVVHTAHAYGRDHFTDLLACTRFTDADVIGAASFSLSSGEILNADLEHRFADFVHPHSALAKREVVVERGWPDEMPAAFETLDEWRREGLRYYSGDRGNFRADSALGLPPGRVDRPAAAIRTNP